tara:strand:+ start:1274 stop:1717 length:444 start_codon:yes stop_codon:yes gene_type:complete
MSSSVFQYYAREIKKQTGMDCFSSRRTDAHAIARAILNQVYKKEFPDATLELIQSFYIDNGKPMNHATILHSLRSFDQYNNLPLRKQIKELGMPVKNVYYALLLSRLNLNIGQKIPLLLPEQAQEVNRLIDNYAKENVKMYLQENAE